eukprot:16186030-Heterocapsa_arctica.AAC.1
MKADPFVALGAQSVTPWSKRDDGALDQLESQAGDLAGELEDGGDGQQELDGGEGESDAVGAGASDASLHGVEKGVEE